MTIWVLPKQCQLCQRFGNKAEYQGDVPVCEAFPQGIPEEILNGKNKHLTPFPGDHDLQFIPVKQ